MLFICLNLFVRYKLKQNTETTGHFTTQAAVFLRSWTHDDSLAAVISGRSQQVLRDGCLSDIGLHCSANLVWRSTGRRYWSHSVHSLHGRDV